jgi:hypothetical protein
MKKEKAVQTLNRVNYFKPNDPVFCTIDGISWSGKVLSQANYDYHRDIKLVQVMLDSGTIAYFPPAQVVMCEIPVGTKLITISGSLPLHTACWLVKVTPKTVQVRVGNPTTGFIKNLQHDDIRIWTEKDPCYNMNRSNNTL